jgi:beta-glucosidase
MNGRHAPGIKRLERRHQSLAPFAAVAWASVRVIRRNSPGAEVGITLNLSPTQTANPNPAPYHSARYVDGYINRWFLDPLYGREYPADMVRSYTEKGYLPTGMDFVQPGDMEAIIVPTDFLGINYYMRHLVGEAPDMEDARSLRGGLAEAEHTEMGWEVYPPGLFNLLSRLHFDYQPPKIYVTENGASYSDGPDAAGHINDERRRSFLERHFAAAYQAIQLGVPLAGFYVWSLLDNFEWAEGYAQRFGITWVDFETQQRIPKASALWYREVIANNGF